MLILSVIVSSTTAETKPNQTGGTELIPMPHPTEAAQLSLPFILYSAFSCDHQKLLYALEK